MIKPNLSICCCVVITDCVSFMVLNTHRPMHYDQWVSSFGNNRPYCGRQSSFSMLVLSPSRELKSVTVQYWWYSRCGGDAISCISVTFTRELVPIVNIFVPEVRIVFARDIVLGEFSDLSFVMSTMTFCTSGRSIDWKHTIEKSLLSNYQ